MTEFVKNISHSVEMRSVAIRYDGYGHLHKDNELLLKMCHGIITFMNWVNRHRSDTVVLCCNVEDSAKLLQD